MNYYYYLKVESAKKGTPLLLKKSDTRITDMDAEFGSGVAVEYVGESLPFSVVYNEDNHTVRAATVEERRARSKKRLYAGMSLLGKVWTDKDFNLEDLVHVAGDDVNGTLKFLANVPFTIPYNKGFHVYLSNGQAATCMQSENTTINITGNGIAGKVGGNFRANGTINYTGALTAGGDVIAFSDKRIKKNIKKINNALELCRNIEGVYFDRVDDDTKHIGFVADEVEKFVPEAVSKDMTTGLKGVAYGNMTAIAFNAIRELSDMVSELRKEVKTLRAEVENRDEIINKLLLIRGDNDE